MDGTAVFLVILVVAIGIGLIPAFVAQARGHSFILFLLLSLLISPILALILAFVITPAKPARRRTRRYQGASSRGRTAARNRRRAPVDARNPYRAPSRS